MPRGLGIGLALSLVFAFSFYVGWSFLNDEKEDR